MFLELATEITVYSYIYLSTFGLLSHYICPTQAFVTSANSFWFIKDTTPKSIYLYMETG